MSHSSLQINEDHHVILSRARDPTPAPEWRAASGMAGRPGGERTMRVDYSWGAGRAGAYGGREGVEWSGRWWWEVEGGGGWECGGTRVTVDAVARDGRGGTRE